VAIIDRNVDKQGPEARAAAEAFLRYCFTPEAQREFAACGSLELRVASCWLWAGWTRHGVSSSWHSRSRRPSEKAATLLDIQFC